MHSIIHSFDSFFPPAYYESLQDKLAQLKDAREALNDLREEHNERKRREREELERQRQVAMAARLEKLRQKKQVSGTKYSGIWVKVQ